MYFFTLSSGPVLDQRLSLVSSTMQYDPAVTMGQYTYSGHARLDIGSQSANAQLVAVELQCYLYKSRYAPKPRLDTWTAPTLSNSAFLKNVCVRVAPPPLHAPAAAGKPWRACRMGVNHLVWAPNRESRSVAGRLTVHLLL
eukprot:366384-Chlamydomonas_euryale.AAC.17